MTATRPVAARAEPRALTAVIEAQPDDVWLDDLAVALKAAGLRVLRADDDELADVAYRTRARLVVLAPEPGASPAERWMLVSERAPKYTPVHVVRLPAERAELAGDWLAAGFDDVVSDETAVAVAAGRLRGRVRGRDVLHSLASRDPLTSLDGRLAFMQRLDPDMRLASRTDSALAVVILDIDGFLAFTRAQGRSLANEVIRGVADHLRTHLRRSDIVARITDDRFGLVLHHIRAFEAKRLVRKLTERVAFSDALLEQLPIDWRRPRFSTGIAVFPGDASTGAELFTRAELALEVSRAEGGGRATLYTEIGASSGADVGPTDLRLHRSATQRRDDLD